MDNNQEKHIKQVIEFVNHKKAIKYLKKGKKITEEDENKEWIDSL
jgi:hypothetical protein